MSALSPNHVTYNANTTELGRTVGSVFVGYVLSMILYGFNSYQLYIYFSTVQKERSFKKWTIGFLGLLDSASVGLMTHVMDAYMIAQFPFIALPAVKDATNPFCADNLVALITICLVQIAYAERVRKYNKLYAAALAFAALVALALGIGMTIQLIRTPDFDDLKSPAHLGIAATCQVLTFIVSAFTFAIFMLHEKPVSPTKSGLAKNFDQTISVIFERGGASTVIQGGYMFILLVSATHRYWIPFQFVARRLFFLSLLTLYVNDAVREHRFLAYSGDETLKPISFKLGEPQSSRAFVAKGPSQVFEVSVTQEIMEDSESFKPSK
jgi:hypothetical protein